MSAKRRDRLKMLTAGAALISAFAPGCGKGKDPPHMNAPDPNPPHINATVQPTPGDAEAPKVPVHVNAPQPPPSTSK